MKRVMVAGLVRLYPSKWRVEYGEELASVLMQRPLRASGMVDVVGNAMCQQLRLQEPWVIVGSLLTLWVSIAWVKLLTSSASVASNSGSPEIGIAAFCGVGLWTVMRRGGGGGRAAIRVAMLVAVPYFLLGLLTLAQIVRVDEMPGGTLSFRLYGPPSYGAKVFRWFVEIPILQIPFAGLLGWIGGLVGQIGRRCRV